MWTYPDMVHTLTVSERACSILSFLTCFKIVENYSSANKYQKVLVTDF